MDLRIVPEQPEPGVDIRPCEPGDEDGVIELFERCHGRPLSASYWQWKLKRHHAGYDNVFVATRGGRIVGHYAGVPVDAWVNGQRKPVIAPVDAMVDPPMRRRRILSALVTHAHSAWQRAGVQFCYGLPNEQWSAVSLGWVPLFPLQWLRRVLRPEAVLARRSRIRSIASLGAIGAISRRLQGRPRTDADIDIEEIVEPHADLDVVAAAGRQGNRVQIIRGCNWVDGRYFRCPEPGYRVLLARRGKQAVGYAVYRVREADSVTATVAEVITRLDDSHAYSTLIADIERRCLEAKAEAINVLAVPASTNWQRLKGCGFSPRNAAFEFHFAPLQAGVQDMRPADAWVLEGGDFDVV